MYQVMGPPIIDPSFKPSTGTTISWTPQTTPSTLGDYEVNIEQVQHGFIVTA